MADNVPYFTNADRALLRLAENLRERGYRFITVSPATHARVNARDGNAEARSLEDVFGWSRPFRPGSLSTELEGLMREAGVVAEDGRHHRSLVRLSSLGGELFLHSAFPTVENHAVFFGPDTYRFARAVELGLRGLKPGVRVVDIGSGAGPGGILVAKAWPQAEVVLADVNDRALRLSRVNAALAGVGEVVACRSDLLSGVDGSFDLIVSNPPYLNDPLERAYRHGGGTLGAALSAAIVETALDRLSSEGTLILYTGVAIVSGRDPFRAAIETMLSGRDLDIRYEEVDPDVFGEELETPAYRAADRIAAVVLTATRKG